jgi:nitrate/TMAO reductase-like tetraheme cytochrome c subunit
MMASGVGAILVLGVATVVVYGGGPPAEAKYLGTNACKKCHLKQHETWSKNKHAKTFDRLQGGERKDPKCLKCHATGSGEVGGFVNEEQTPQLTAVGCEACHGPSSAHVAAAKESLDADEWDKKINKVPQTCVKCHNPHFDHKEQFGK